MIRVSSWSSLSFRSALGEKSEFEKDWSPTQKKSASFVGKYYSREARERSFGLKEFSVSISKFDAKTCRSHPFVLESTA